MNHALAEGLLEALREDPGRAVDVAEAARESRPTPEQRAVMDRLAKIVDARAHELEVSAEILAPRGELKALAMGTRTVPVLSGWRREEIGDRLLMALD